jgi:ribonuclease VapC
VNDAARPSAVLDASALLAFMREETGADRVEAMIGHGALVSAVNWAEVLARIVVSGGDPHEIVAMALPAGAATRLELIPFDAAQARETARMMPYTRGLGLSLADRAALALAATRRLRVLTADRAWRSLRLPIKIEVIR